MKRIVVGIDPGKKGGICVFSGEYIDDLDGKMSSDIKCFPMPIDEYDEKTLNIQPIVDEIESRVLKLSYDRSDVYVYIEKVGAMPGQGVVSMFTFGKGFGQLIGMCQAKGWNYTLVRPQVWKKAILPDGEHDKDASISYASQIVGERALIPPRCKKHHDGMADAVCIMEYGIVDLKNKCAILRQG